MNNNLQEQLRVRKCVREIFFEEIHPLIQKGIDVFAEPGPPQAQALYAPSLCTTYGEATFCSTN